MKPYYSKNLMIIDFVLCLLTGFTWLLIVIPRELYRMNKRK